MGRFAAFAASRSTSVLRGTIMTSRPCHRFIAARPTTSSLRYISTTPLRSADGWPSRPAPTRVEEPSSIKRPDTSAYDRAPAAPTKDSSSSSSSNPFEDDDDFALDLDLSLADLRKTPKTMEHVPAPLTHDLHCGPRLGRTINLTKNVDVGRAFKLLAQSVAANKIVKTVRLQREYERPGLKRKRLKSERWQRRFKTGFKATVKRVRQLTAQGW